MHFKRLQQIQHRIEWDIASLHMDYLSYSSHAFIVSNVDRQNKYTYTTKKKILCKQNQTSLLSRTSQSSIRKSFYCIVFTWTAFFWAQKSWDSYIGCRHRSFIRSFVRSQKHKSTEWKINNDEKSLSIPWRLDFMWNRL